jgi:RNA-directed DNA polymerase
MKGTKTQPITKLMVWNAWQEVKGNGKGAGVDRLSLKAFEANLSRNLYKIWNRMASGSYMPPAVRQVDIVKDGGGTRTLGIPTVADRVAQMVVKMRLEPRIDPIFHESSFGYRPGRGAHDALAQARANCWRMKWVIDMDIKAFFDEIDHGLLMLALQRHTTEKWVLLYVGRWLTAPMERPDGTLAQRNMGTPQGGVISPLLANLFLHYAFDMWMRKSHPKFPFERYADDIVVHCRTKAEANALTVLIRKRLEASKLRLHPDKTKVVHCKDGDSVDPHPNVCFDFLGYTFRPRLCKNPKTCKMFLGFTPAASTKSLKKINDQIRQLRIQRWSGYTLEEIAERLNPKLRGWIHYYGRFTPSVLASFFHTLDKRLLKWAQNRHKRFRTNKYKALDWLKCEARQKPHLLAHWAAGMGLAVKQASG